MRTYEKKSLSKFDKSIQQNEAQSYGGVLQLSRMVPPTGNQAFLSSLGRSPQSHTSSDCSPLAGAMRKKFERLSGVSLDDVRVHYHSDKPDMLGAEAYAQGNEIFIGPGNEHTLEHEVGHVVQQKQGLVKPTGTIAGMPLNDNQLLENSAVSPKKVLISQVNASGKQSNTIQMTKSKKRAKRYDPFRPGRWEEYRNFGEGSKFVIKTPWGKVLARYFRRSAYITSKKEDFGDEVGRKGTYEEFVDGLKDSGLKDEEIATALLSLNAKAFRKPREKRAAAMLFAVVCLAEEYRKQGAQKVFRAYLRLCMDRKVEFSLEEMKKKFKFSVSANDGCLEIAQIKALKDGRCSPADLPKEVVEVAEELSDDESADGYESDPEVRERKDKGRKRQRPLRF